MEGVVPSNNELKLYYNDPKAVEGFTYLNKLWNEQLINKDYFIEKPEQITEKLSNGRVAVYAGNGINGDLNSARQNLLKKDPTNNYIVIDPPAASGIDQAKVYNASYSTLGWNVVSVTKNAKNPERIFQLLDYIVSDEGTLFTSYGPKGELYDQLDENGYPILKKSLSSLTQNEQKALGAGLWTLMGNTLYMDNAKVADDNRKPEDQRDWVAQAQSKFTWKHSMNADAYVGTTTDPQSPEGIAYTAFNDLDRKFIPKIVMAKNADLCKQAINEAVDSAYKLGFDKVEKFKTDIYNKNLAILGK